MTAYMVVFARIKDRTAFLENYARQAAALVERHGGRYLTRAPGVVALEGDHFDGASAVISEWPDRTAIERFWNSPEYAALKKAREPLADCAVYIIEEPSR
ncbi:MAG: DUF1330 domain-containing protein [Alphaproteobacteria bacterium]|nr:MAG: DUF1330 domain-containing protein [Alphaproteobacteria bacterium]